MDKKWFYRIPEPDRKRYKPSEVIVGYDRLNAEYITLDQVFLVGTDGLKEPKIKDR